MKIYAFIIIAVYGLISINTVLYAGGNGTPFIYDDMGLRDPFVPLVDKDGKFAVPQGSMDSIKDIVLEGILYDAGGGSVAILNGMVLKEKDQVGNIKVKRIEQRRVVVLSDDKEYTLKLKE